MKIRKYSEKHGIRATVRTPNVGSKYYGEFESNQPAFKITITPAYLYHTIGIVGIDIKGSLHRCEYWNFCVNVYTCISVVRPLIHKNLGLN